MNVPPRIFHLIGRLDGYGGSRLMRRLVARQSGAGQGVSVAALSANAAIVRELRATGATVNVVGARWRWDPIALGRLVQLRRRAPVDLVHVWDSTALAYAVATGRREPCVATWDAEGRAAAWFASIIGQSVAALPSGVPPSAREPQRPRDAVLAELDLPPDARLIAVAGPLVRHKQIDEAIWTYELVRVLHPQVRMVVFGDGPDRARLERYADLVSEPSCVQFAGFRADLAELLPHADVFWQLDAARTTPYALLEAMAAGVPAVASDVPALRAAIVSGETGYLAPLGHRAGVARATDQLLSDAALAGRIGAAGAAFVARAFSLEKAFAACDALYRAVDPRHVFADIRPEAN